MKIVIEYLYHHWTSESTCVLAPFGSMHTAIHGNQTYHAWYSNFSVLVCCTKHLHAFYMHVFNFMYVCFGYKSAQLRESPFSKMAAIDLYYDTYISPASANLTYFCGLLVFKGTT